VSENPWCQDAGPAEVLRNFIAKKTSIIGDGLSVIMTILFDITLWLFNVAMENDPFIDGLPITNGDFPWLC